MQVRYKIRQVGARKRRSRKTTESAWGKARRSQTRSWRVRLMSGSLLLVAGGGLVLWLLHGGAERRLSNATQIPDGDTLRDGLESAETVARAFLKETDPARRLQWVCKAEEVKTRMAEYAEEARSEAGEIEKVLGHQMDGGRTVTGFVVEFPSGNLRLLEVIGTPDGGMSLRSLKLLATG